MAGEVTCDQQSGGHPPREDSAAPGTWQPLAPRKEYEREMRLLRPVAIRYSWPAELDLMASRAGLQLTERHAGWDRQPYTSASDSHVSVYQRA
jgi:hypothetical protein